MRGRLARAGRADDDVPGQLVHVGPAPEPAEARTSAPTWRLRSTCSACVKRWPITATSGAPGAAACGARAPRRRHQAVEQAAVAPRRRRRAPHHMRSTNSSSTQAIAIARARSPASGVHAADGDQRADEPHQRAGRIQAERDQQRAHVGGEFGSHHEGRALHEHGLGRALNPPAAATATAPRRGGCARARRRVVGHARLGLGAALGAHPRRRQPRLDQRRGHGLRTLARQVPVRRETQRLQRLVVGVADHLDAPGQARPAPARCDASDRVAALATARVPATNSASAAQRRHRALRFVADLDRAGVEIVGQQRRQPRLDGCRRRRRNGQAAVHVVQLLQQRLGLAAQARRQPHHARQHQRGADHQRDPQRHHREAGRAPRFTGPVLRQRARIGGQQRGPHPLEQPPGQRIELGAAVGQVGVAALQAQRDAHVEQLQQRRIGLGVRAQAIEQLEHLVGARVARRGTPATGPWCQAADWHPTAWPRSPRR